MWVSRRQRQCKWKRMHNGDKERMARRYRTGICLRLVIVIGRKKREGSVYWLEQISYATQTNISMKTHFFSRTRTLKLYSQALHSSSLQCVTHTCSHEKCVVTANEGVYSHILNKAQRTYKHVNSAHGTLMHLYIGTSGDEQRWCACPRSAFAVFAAFTYSQKIPPELNISGLSMRYLPTARWLRRSCIR